MFFQSLRSRLSRSKSKSSKSKTSTKSKHSQHDLSKHPTSIKSSSTHARTTTFDSSIPSITITSPSSPSSPSTSSPSRFPNPKQLKTRTLFTTTAELQNEGEEGDNTEEADAGEEGGEARDYMVFMEKARKEAEITERRRLREWQEARNRNMSPWAARM